MKKAKRIISLLVILTICLSLCGCDGLDELRSSRATLTTHGFIKLYDGTEYILLPDCKELTPPFNEYEMVYIVEEDLPLLLTSFSDNYAIKSDDGLFLQAYTEHGVFHYCRSDIYSDILERIRNGFVADAYCYMEFNYETGGYTICTLTQVQEDAVTQVLTTQEPETLPVGTTLTYEYYVDLYLCSEDQLFMQHTVDVGMINGKYYVVDSDYVTTLYSVPEELSAEFAGILEKQFEFWGSQE